MSEPKHSPFPAAEFGARCARARQLMSARGVDAVVVTSKENVIYFTGIQTIGWTSKHRPVAAVIPAGSDSPSLVIPISLKNVAAASSWVDNVVCWGG